MKPREGQKRAIFPSLIWGGGGGGLGFPFILSNIVGVLYFNECRVWIFDRCKAICLGNVIQKKKNATVNYLMLRSADQQF